MSPARYAKAIVAAVSAGLLTIQSVISMSDRSRAWITVSIAVVAAVAVYVVPNAPRRSADSGPQEAPDGGDHGLPSARSDSDRDA